jgi:AAHS family 4-hydroxybenzoate transporter-like MFS transporter
MAVPSPPVDVVDLVDRSRLGRFQLGLLLLCGVCLVVDGFDVQAMGYVAPAIIEDWSISRASLGPVFGAGLLGMLVGSLGFSVAADRFGRRPVLIVATAFFAACMLATSAVRTLDQLLVLRLVTGVGLGGIMPQAMALAGEYAPSRVRITVMMLVSCGFTVGAAAGGLVTAALVSALGWRSVFVVGGLVPLAIAAVMLAWLPESIWFLVLKRRGLERARGWLRRIDPAAPITETTELRVRESDHRGVTALQLFHDGRAAGTVLLWIINFTNLLNLYFLSQWLPTVLRDGGFTTSRAVLAGTLLQVGGVLGTLALGRLVDWKGFRVLVVTFAVAAVAIVAIGQSRAGPLLLAAIFVAGFCVIGGQPAVNSLAASYYPTALRSTGIGWSLGIGRFGSILGPVLGGYLIGLAWTPASLFGASAVPAAVSALVTLAMVRWALRPARAAAPFRPPAPAAPHWRKA